MRQTFREPGLHLHFVLLPLPSGLVLPENIVRRTLRDRSWETERSELRLLRAERRAERSGLRSRDLERSRLSLLKERERERERERE